MTKQSKDAKRQSKDAGRQPKRYALENRIATMEASLRMLHTKLDELIADRLETDDSDGGEDRELARNEPVKQVVTQRIGPWQFDVTDHAEVQSNVVLSTALAVLFRDTDDKKVVPVNWNSANGDEENLVQWLREFSGTRYFAFDVSDEKLMLVKAPTGMTDKSKMTELGELLAEVATEDGEICIGNPTTNH